MTRWSRPFSMFAFSTVLALASAARADVLAHWSFDELGGDDHDTFVDSSGNSTKHNALVAEKGQISINVAPDVPFGKAITFTGKTGSYLDLPAIPGLYNHSFTVAVWVYLTKPDHNYVFADWSPPMNMAFAFGFDMPKGSSTDQRVSAWMHSDQVKTNSKTKQKYNPDIVHFTPATKIGLNAWHHAAWVWDQDASPPALTIYLDGTKGETVPLYKGSNPTLLNNHRGPKIGLKQDTEPALFHGSMDELWVFGDALTAAQVTNLMKSNDIAGSATFAAATPPANVTAAAPPTAPANPTAAPTETAANVTGPQSPADNATAQTPVPAPGPAVATGPDAAPASHDAVAVAPAPQTPVFETASPPATAAVVATPRHSRHSTPAPVNEPKPDFLSAARPTATPLPSPVIPIVAAAPHHYTPERLMGLVGTGALALTLSSFLVWATMERGRLQHRPRAR